MTWWGKLVGTGVGMLGGPIGALAGAAIGHLYDSEDQTPMSEKKAKILYWTYFFSCAGKIAKADGTVSEEEIKATESLMERFTLNEKYREYAKNVFRKAKDSKRPIEEDFKELAKLIQYDSTVGQSFLGGLFEIAQSNAKKFNQKQLQRLLIGEKILRLPKGTLKSWISGSYAPFSNHLNKQGEQFSLNESFEILSIQSNANEEEIKRAYRIKVSNFHPDKLKSKELPNEFIDFANAQLAKINEAYKVIKDSNPNL